MPFLAQERVPIPNKDILSWTFDEQHYDQDKPVYLDALDPSRSISSRQARGIIRKLIAGFRAAGVAKGDCVCIHSFNDIYYSMLFLGIVGAGGIFAGTNPAYTQYELTHHYKTSQTKFILVEPDFLPAVLASAQECGIQPSNIWVFDYIDNQKVPSGFSSWRTLLNHGDADWVRFDDEQTSKATTAARLYSSGTTGLPKAAAITHYNLVAQHTLVNETHPPPHEIRRLLYLPMFHAATVPVGHTTPLRSGQVTYVMRRFELEPVLSSIHKYSITDLTLVPPVVVAILKFPGREKYSLKSVKMAFCGAGSLDKETQRQMQALLAPGASLTQVWGMTETSCVASMFYYPEHDDTGSVGRMMPNLDVKLIDNDDNDITAYDVRGELCIRGPTIITSYLGNPEATAASFTKDGYFKTGDIMYCAGDTKKWYIVDRKKELIKVRGFQVAPAEIEGVLLSNPNILDAAVIGVNPGPGSGSIASSKDSDNAGNSKDIELPRAYVVRKPGLTERDLNEEAVKAWCRERLAKYKELAGGVRFIDAIPRNAAGKPLKRLLRERAKAEEEKETRRQGAKL
ncbi:Phenylacetyl-CoA ligase epaB [Exophiala dermatitidis]